MDRHIGLSCLFICVALTWTGHRSRVEAVEDQATFREETPPGSSLRMMTFNIRYGTANDGENSWPQRRQLLFDVVQHFDPDVLGVQEGLRGQLDELVEQFPHYVVVGAGREPDGSGEYSSIFIRRSRFDLWESGTFWLSDTPAQPGSTSWGNQLPRICTWVRLLDRQTNQRFYVFNTHWDHQSQAAREGAGQLIAQRVITRPAGNEPVVVMGDFNVGGDNPARASLDAGGLRDSFFDKHSDEIDQPGTIDVGTFNYFGGKSGGHKIDAILISPDWQVLDAAIDRTQRNGRFPSDHFPVTATLSFRHGSASDGEDSKE